MDGDGQPHDRKRRLMTDAVTQKQLTLLAILRQREGYTPDAEGRAAWFRFVHTNIARWIDSNRCLSKAEASVLIDLLLLEDPRTSPAKPGRWPIVPDPLPRR
jgi:hypothetical protein